MPTERLANQLRVARAEQHLTQEALAEQAGTTRKSINAIEMQRMVPSTLLALKIARALDSSVERLFSLVADEQRGEHR
jgi:putative transcriptional regulator